MDTIEKTLKYYPLVMKYDDTSKFKEYKLPEGFRFKFFQPGDEQDWIDIHISSGEFTDEELASVHFHEYYDDFIDELSERCVFIVDSNTGEKVGTATISKYYDEQYGYDATVDWVAIKKEYQGKGLAKPLISKFMKIAHDNGHDRVLLHTQTHTWLAAKLYLDFGFEPIIEEEIMGWRILNTIIDHDKLQSVGTVSNEDMYSRTYVMVANKIKEIYGNDITYEIWDKNNMNKVYVRCNNQFFKFKFSIDSNGVRLEEDKVIKIS